MINQSQRRAHLGLKTKVGGGLLLLLLVIGNVDLVAHRRLVHVGNRLDPIGKSAAGWAAVVAHLSLPRRPPPSGRSTWSKPEAESAARHFRARRRRIAARWGGCRKPRARDLPHRLTGSAAAADRQVLLLHGAGVITASKPRWAASPRKRPDSVTPTSLATVPSNGTGKVRPSQSS